MRLAPSVPFRFLAERCEQVLLILALAGKA
jgi:hypothetical protein